MPVLKFPKSSLLVLALVICFCCPVEAQTSKIYDIVLQGGRVIDPETGLDTVKNVGIINNRIDEISSKPLRGKEIVNVSGLVVAPGFIDLHVHGRTNQEQEYQLHDGVTTALETEFGTEFLTQWYASRKSKALINYGASVSWAFERFRTLGNFNKELNQLKQTVVSGESGWQNLFNTIQPTYTNSLSPDQTNLTLANIRKSLDEGALGIGVPIAYVPGAKPDEIFEVYKLAAGLQAPVFTHVREAGIMAFQQAIADAAVTGAPLHICHINSSSQGEIYFAIELIQAARSRGLDITAELYPYTASSTKLESALFNDGWQQRRNISYGDLQWVATGERLTKETFDSYRKSGGIVIIHSMQPEWIKAGIAASGIMIASDAVPYARLAHPRSAGAFSRVLGKYVRDEKVLSLPDAIEKMTLLPAKRLEGISPMMKQKGRIQVGSDADITIFDPKTIIDKATFEKGLEFSEGVEHVLVNGSFVLRNGNTVSNVFPGQPIYGKYRK